jgi:hypothetical protein
MISVLGQVGWRSRLMGFDGIKGILRDVIVTLGREVIEDFAHQRINTRPTLLG